MDIRRAILFTPKFFKDSKSIKDFVSGSMNYINAIKNFEEKNIEALNRAILINDLSKNILDKSSLDYMKVAEANLLEFVGYRTENVTYLEKAIEILNSVLLPVEDSFITNKYHFVRGKCCMYLYSFQEYGNKNGIDTIKKQELLYEAKKHFSILLNKIFSEDINAEDTNPNKIILHYCEVLGHLSRYVEPFYLLDKILKEDKKLSGSIAISKFILLESIKDKTCDHTNPLMILKIKKFLLKALSDKNIDSRNIPTLKDKVKEMNLTLNYYESKHGKSEKELDKIAHQGLKQFEKHNSYHQFCLKRHLLLNEHSLYCSCKMSVNDDLRIEAGCDHTRIDKILKFQLLLEQLKMEFDCARQSYFRASDLKGKSKLFKNTVKSSIKEESILINSEIIEITNCFSKCFSILDKIAVGVNSAFNILKDKRELSKIYFNSFFNRRDVKKFINSKENNLYLLAMYSISQDLNKNNPFSEFYEFKSWRNAIEHNQLCLISEDGDITNLKAMFPDVSFFVKEKEFRNKTLFMLQICRSAIFTFTWLIRKASIDWEKN